MGVEAVRQARDAAPDEPVLRLAETVAALVREDTAGAGHDLLLPVVEAGVARGVFDVDDAAEATTGVVAVCAGLAGDPATRPVRAAAHALAVVRCSRRLADLALPRLASDAGTVLPERVRVPARQVGMARLLAALGPQDHLRWVLRDVWFGGEVAPLWPEGTLAAESRSQGPDGLPAAWADLVWLAEHGVSVADGTLTGCDDDGPAVEVRAVETVAWHVWARDRELLATLMRVVPEAQAETARTPGTGA